jgi:hypothetical protein
MTHNKCLYQWTDRDKRFYFISLIPFLIAFVGAAYILATVSIYLTALFLGLYIICNIFQAGACVGCPYRGKFCPAVFGVYLSNIISATIYKKRSFEQRFFDINATAASIMSLITLLFPVYWLFISGWYYLTAYIAIVIIYLILFYSFFCPKCSYSETCPGGRAAHKILRR